MAMMTVQQIFDLGVKRGIENDPRGISGVKKHLTRVKKQYDELGENERKYFDPDRLPNPSPDSAVHVDDGKTKVKRILAGIDISAADMSMPAKIRLTFVLPSSTWTALSGEGLGRRSGSKYFLSFSPNSSYC